LERISIIVIEPVAGGGEAGPVVGAELARAEPLRLDLRLAAHQALGDLRLRHLEREDGDGLLLADGEVGGHAEPEPGLAHARAGGDDDQVPRLEAGGEPVEVTEPGWCAGDLGAGLVERGDALEAVLQQLLDVTELARHPGLGEIEDDLLRPVDELRSLAWPLPAEDRDLAARPYQPAECRHLPHDPRVVPGVRARGNERRELVDANASTRIVELAAFLELVDEGDRVDGLAPGVQRERGAVDLGVTLAVEVARIQCFADRPDRAGGEHHRAKD
jgi:hypothetical protein